MNSADKNREEAAMELETKNQAEAASAIQKINVILTNIESVLNVASPHPNYNRWGIGFGASPGDILKDSTFGFYIMIPNIDVAEKIFKHFSNSIGTRMMPLANERVGSEMDVKYIGVKLKG